MAIYTGVADANGDFNIPFSANYTSGQKITVTAEKDSATKSIELYAPSEPLGGGAIQFSGTLNDFPQNIGAVTLRGLIGVIGNNAFDASGNQSISWRLATGLIIESGITSIGAYAFRMWASAVSLTLPSGITSIGGYAFQNWKELSTLVIPNTVTEIGSQAFGGASKITSLTLSNQLKTIGSAAFLNLSLLTSLLLPATLTSIGADGFGGLAACLEITSLAVAPPTITATTFSNLKATCIIKVPAASVTAYQSAPNWSAFASRIQAI